MRFELGEEQGGAAALPSAEDSDAGARLGSRWRAVLAEPTTWWIGVRFEPRLSSVAAGFWVDLAAGELAAGEAAPSEAGSARRTVGGALGRWPDVPERWQPSPRNPFNIALPLVDGAALASRELFAARVVASADVRDATAGQEDPSPAFAWTTSWRPGQAPTTGNASARGLNVLDLSSWALAPAPAFRFEAADVEVEAEALRFAEAVKSCGGTAWGVWPLVAGVSDSPARLEGCARLLRAAGFEGMRACSVTVRPAERRALVDAHPGAFEALFHGPTPGERPFAALISRAGLSTMPRWPLWRGSVHARVVEQLHLAAEWAARLKHPEPLVAGLRGQARRLAQLEFDLGQLARDGHLDLVPGWDPLSRRIANEALHDEESAFVEEMRSEYLDVAPA